MQRWKPEKSHCINYSSVCNPHAKILKNLPPLMVIENLYLKLSFPGDRKMHEAVQWAIMTPRSSKGTYQRNQHNTALCLKSISISRHKYPINQITITSRKSLTKTTHSLMQTFQVMRCIMQLRLFHVKSNTSIANNRYFCWIYVSSSSRLELHLNRQ